MLAVSFALTIVKGELCRTDGGAKSAIFSVKRNVDYLRGCMPRDDEVVGEVAVCWGKVLEG